MANADYHGVKLGGYPYYKPSQPSLSAKPLILGVDVNVACTASVAITFPNMTTVLACSVEEVVGTAPGDKTSYWTYTKSGNTVTIFGWKTTSGADPTLVAATDASVIDVIAVGI